MEPKQDFNNLAAKAFKDGVEMKNDPRVEAELYLEGKPFAVGQATVANDGVRFFPEPAETLKNRLTGRIYLKVLESGELIQLKHRPEGFDVGGETMWFFIKHS